MVVHKNSNSRDAVWWSASFVYSQKRGVWDKVEKKAASHKPHPLQRGRVWSHCDHQVATTTEICCDQWDPRSSKITVVVMSRVFNGCQHLIIKLRFSIIAFLGDTSLASAWPDPSSLWRVWLLRWREDTVDIYTPNCTSVTIIGA